MSDALHRSQEGHELDRLKLTYAQLFAQLRHAQDAARERAIADELEIQRLKARNVDLVRDVEKLTILGKDRSTNWRGLFGRWLGFGKVKT